MILIFSSFISENYSSDKDDSASENPDEELGGKKLKLGTF